LQLKAFFAIVLFSTQQEKHMKKLFALAKVIIAYSFTFLAQAQHVIVVNGGQFGNPNERANIVRYNTQTGTHTVLDTIGVNSIQDLLIEGDFAYVAAQDSIVKYNLTTGKRIAANAFGGVSTIKLGIYGNQLVVGNWYFPFGSNSYDKNFRIFDKNTLQLDTNLAFVQRGATDFAIIGDTAYIVQNFTSSNFSDSAGYIAVVNLNTRQYVREIRFNDNKGLGRIFTYNNKIYLLNRTDSTIATYNPATGAASKMNFSLPIRVRSNGQQFALHADTLFFTFGNRGIGAFSLSSMQIIDTNIIDTVVTAFTYDTVSKRFYITQTNFFSYTKGGIYSRNGAKVGNLPVGYSPEAIGMWYGIPTFLRSQVSTNFQVSIYPNPVQELLSVQLPDNIQDQVNWKMIDAQGKIVKMGTLSAAQNGISVQELATGNYLLQLTTQNRQQVTTQRFVVIK
jgi:hypothetical protein